MCNICVQYQSSCAPKLARKCEDRDWTLFSLWCGRTNGRAVYGHVITQFSGMGRFTYPWCSTGALGAPDLRYYTHSIRKSIAAFVACITFRGSIFSLQRFFTASHIIIYAKRMDYLRFGIAQAGFVCLLFSPWRHITRLCWLWTYFYLWRHPIPDPTVVQAVRRACGRI